MSHAWDIFGTPKHQGVGVSGQSFVNHDPPLFRRPGLGYDGDMRALACLLLILLAACGTPLERCLWDASADLRTLERERDQYRGNLELIAEDCEAWLKSESDEPSVEFIKLVAKYAREAIK